MVARGILSHIGSLSLAVASLGAAGCAGPTTPLGAPWTIGPLAIKGRVLEWAKVALPGSPGESRLSFEPGSQRLFGGHPLTVRIDDPLGVPDRFRLRVRYNGIDVSTSFMRQATVERSGEARSAWVRIPVLRLSAGSDHDIVFEYRRDRSEEDLPPRASARLAPPSCDPFGSVPVARTGSFSPDPKLLRLIERVARERKFSAAFVAALIAQESRFDPLSVSTAGALGLTQVTRLADEHLARRYSDWPRYPGIHELSYPTLKLMVLSGHLNGSNEWRLNEGRSIAGGLAFASMLSERWKGPENAAWIRAAFREPERESTRLMLASYNAGFARVYSALSHHGSAWLEAEELRGVRGYVNRILSYCDYFGGDVGAGTPAKGDQI